MLSIPVAGAELALLPSGAAWLPEASTLLVADAHFGKATSFRRLGVPVPEMTTTETLQALSAAIRDTQARRLVFLGDLLHARGGRSEALFDEMQQWRDEHADLQIVLVRGNHDRRAGDPPERLRIEVVGEPMRLGSFALCHDPVPDPHAYVLAGHWHPCVRVGRAFDSVRLPCFWLGEKVGVLPAFGRFTGMHPIDRQAGDRVFAIAGPTIREVPAR